MGKRDQVPRPPGGRPNVEKNKGGKGAHGADKKNTFLKKKLPKKKKYSKEKKRKEKKRKEKKRK
jgi:hypothetical protein